MFLRAPSGARRQPPSVPAARHGWPPRSRRCPRRSRPRRIHSACVLRRYNSLARLMNFKPKTVLIVDDDEGMRDTLNAILRRDYRVLRAASGEAALAILNREDVDLMLLDVRLPGIDGFDVLRIVKENYSLVEVIMISAITEIETAVKAMKHGAYHYITKDFDYDQLRSLVRHAGERQDLNRQVLTLSAQVAEQTDREFVVGSSKIARDIIHLVHKIAKLSPTGLILGETW